MQCTDRYSSLSSVHHQLQFLELQRDLLLEFNHDLVANSDEQSGVGPLHTQFMAYLNASNYITTVLKEWGEQMVNVGVVIGAVGYSVQLSKIW